MLLARLYHVSAWTNVQPILECSGVAVFQFSSAARFDAAHRCTLLPCFPVGDCGGRVDAFWPR
jgi:hypothetical protein